MLFRRKIAVCLVSFVLFTSLSVIFVSAFPSSYSNLSDTSNRGPLPTANGIAVWSFNAGSGTGSIPDNTGHGYQLTFPGSPNNPSWTAGRFRYGLSYDGAGDKLTSTWDSPFDMGTSDFTVEAWIKRSTTGSTDTIVGHSSSNDGWVLRVASDNRLQLRLRYTISGNTIEDNAYSTSTIGTSMTFLSAVADYTGGSRWAVTLYINGVADGGTQSLGIGDISGSANLGAGASSSSSTGTFGGMIDELGVYSIAKTSSQILSDYIKSKYDIYTSDGTTSSYGLLGGEDTVNGRVSFKLNLDNNTHNGFTVAGMSNGDKYEVDFTIGAKEFALYFVASGASSGTVKIWYRNAGSSDQWATGTTSTQSSIVSGTSYPSSGNIYFRLTDSTSSTQGTVELEATKSYLAGLGATGRLVNKIAAYTFSGVTTDSGPGSSGGVQEDRSPSGSGTAFFNLSGDIPDLPLGIHFVIMLTAGIYLYARKGAKYSRQKSVTVRNIHRDAYRCHISVLRHN